MGGTSLLSQYIIRGEGVFTAKTLPGNLRISKLVGSAPKMAASFNTFALGSFLLLHAFSLGNTQDPSPSQHSDSPLPDGTVRLTGGFQPYQGRVEIYHEDVWGTICETDWSPSNALVLCRQLGYGGVSSSPGPVSFGEGTGPIYLEGLNCGGYEDRLADCPKTAWEGPVSCGHAQDVGVTCSVGGDQATAAPLEIKDSSLRLSDGTMPHNGRVEIYYQGVWGTICRDGTDVHAPDIVCKQLGFESADPPAAVPAGGYGPGLGVIQLGHVICQGNEAKLAFCAHDKWGENDCTHADDVMLSCKTYTPPEDGDLRLVAGGDVAQGQVEINYQGVWGSVCDTDWTIKDATVVCRQLGFQPARASLSYSYFLDEDSTNPIFFDNVECEGSEARLEDCVHSWRGGACQHFEDVGVICGAPLVFKPVTTEDGRVRLRGGTYPHNGRVEIKYQGEWGTVCDQNWNIEAANVVCRQLGYPSADSALPRAFFGKGSGVIHLDQVNCEGRESELAFCTHAGWDDNECEHGQDASVVCTATLPAGATPDGSIRLGGGDQAGRLQVHYQGVWGTVCQTNWQAINSDVACKELGYWSADSERPFYDDPAPSTSTAPIMLAEVRCSGNEERLVDCSHGGWANTECTHAKDIGISCDTKPTTSIPTTTSPPAVTTTSPPVVTTAGPSVVTTTHLPVVIARVNPSTKSPTFGKSTTPTSQSADFTRHHTEASGDDKDGSDGHIGGQGSTTSGPVLRHDEPTQDAFPPVWVIVVIVLMIPAIIILFAIGIYVKGRHSASYKAVDSAVPQRV